MTEDQKNVFNVGVKFGMVIGAACALGGGVIGLATLFLLTR